MGKRSMVWAMVGMLAAGLLLGGCGGQGGSASNDGKIHIGVIQPVEHPALDASVKGFADGLAQRGYKDGDKIVLDKQNAQGDQSNMETIVNRFIADKDKLIYAVATSTAQVAAFTSGSTCHTLALAWGPCTAIMATALGPSRRGMTETSSCH